MEALLIFVGVAVWVVGPIRILRLLSAAVEALFSAKNNGRSFSDEFFAQQHGIGRFEVRGRLDHVTGDRPFDVFRIEVRGIFPIARTTKLVSSAAVFDITEAEPDGIVDPKPVACSIEQYQERDTISFQDITPLGRVEVDHGFSDWRNILGIIPETLIPPKGGRRKFRAFVALFDEDAPVKFRRGFIESGDVIYQHTLDFDWDCPGEGYEERAANRRRAEELSLQLALSLAYVDGTWSVPEGETVKAWTSRRIDMLDQSEQLARKAVLNDVIRTSARLAKEGRSPTFNHLMEEMKRVASQAECFEAVELCLDVMSSDGHADKRELQLVNQMARTLGVEIERFQAMKDKKIASLSMDATSAGDFHALLGIESTWGEEQIKGHLNKMYSKWNSRAESSIDAKQREEAEKMLETIATARRTLIK